MNKNINDIKYKEYKKKRLFKVVIVLISVIIIILEIMALFQVISMVWGLILFIVLYLLKKIVLK